jgi:predicted nuclease of predicted toxin-antitoxin system
LATFKFFTDTHIPLPAIEEIRSKGIDVLRSIEAGFAQNETDLVLLEYATKEQRIIITCDFDFELLALKWQNKNRDHASILYLSMATRACKNIGLILEWVDLILETANEDESLNQIWRAKK